MMQNRPQSDDRSSFNDEQEDSFAYKEKPNTNQKKGFWPDHMDRPQIIMLIVLGFVGVGVLVLAMVQLKGGMTVPWPTSVTDQRNPYYENKEFSLDTPDEVSQMKNKDTDQDGISDYDELEIYNTSPYLDDSDSDGITDKDEIITGTDPNCPEGRNCFYVEQSDDLIDEDTGSLDSIGTASVTTEQVAVPTIQELRVLLQESGQLTQDQLDQITDSQLEDLYKKMVEENPDVKDQVVKEAQESPTGLATTPDQIKEVLRQSGVSEEDLAQFTDQQLIDLYGQAVKDVAVTQQ